jgi:hypothetical protein
LDDHENEGFWKVVSQVFWASAEGDEMTKDEILSMARESGFERLFGDVDWVCLDEDLERFAALIAEKEREAILSLEDSAGNVYAEAIRARGNK